MQQYSFPILEWKEITSYLLADAGILLEEQHFVKPTTEVLWPVYENLVLISMGITREEPLQPAYHAVPKLRYPELHEESVGTLTSVRAISKLMAITGVHDFSMMDLFKPDSKRTITNLSAIINFLKFKEEKRSAFAPVFEQKQQSLALSKQTVERLAEFAFESLNTQDKFGCSLIDEGWTVIESPQILPLFDLQISCNFEENLPDSEELQLFSTPENDFENSLNLSPPATESLEDLGDEPVVEVKSMPPLGVSHADCADWDCRMQFVLPVIGINEDTFTDILSQNEGENSINTQDKPGWSFIDDGWTVIARPGSPDDVREAHDLVFGP